MCPTMPYRDEFADLIMDRLLQAGEKVTLVYDQQQFCLLVNWEVDPAKLSPVRRVEHLAPWYERYSQAADDSQRAMILNQFVDHWFAAKQQASSGRAADIDRLIPLVRSRFHHEMTKLQFAAGDPQQAAEIESQLIYQIFSEHLAVTVGEPFQHSYRQLTRNDLAQLGMRFEDALATAKSNLVRHNPNFAGGAWFKRVHNRLWCSAGEPTASNSAALLFPEEIRRLPVQGQHVAVVPHSEIVWITGSAEHEALHWLSERVLREFGESPAPISALPFILDNDQWRLWLPPTKHPAHAAMKQLHLADESAAYDEQAGLLQQKHQAEHVDSQIAAYRPMEITEDDGKVEYYSLCIWTESVASLLPRTDIVAIQRVENRTELENGEADRPASDEMLCVPWERFEAHLGARLHRQNVYPERYGVDTTLDQSSWRTLAGEQHHFATALLEAIADSVATEAIPLRSVEKPPRSDETKAPSGGWWWMFAIVLGCAGVFATLLLFITFVGVSIFWARSVPHPVASQPLPSRAVELPAFAALDRPDFALPELSWQRDELVASPLGGSERPPVYRDIAPTGGWLVGVRLTQGPNWDGAIRAIQPIYQVSDKYHLGDRHGLPGGVSQSQLLARPGYAIGAVTVRAGLVMNAIQIDFHRVIENRLDTNDAYQSAWVGSDGGQTFEPLGNNGMPIVGISGSYVEDQFGIRIYQPIPLDRTP